MYNNTQRPKQGAEKGLQRFLLTLLLVSVALIGSATLIWASDVSDADYYGVITISNNDSAETFVSTNGSLNTPAMITSGFLNGSANNCAVRTTSGTDVAFMPSITGYPWCFWVNSIGADSYLSYLLYTGNVTGGKIRYFHGVAGMTSSDNADMELDDSFEVEQVGWCDVTQLGSQFGSLSPSYIRKIGAFYIHNTASGDITAQIGADCLDFERTNSDYVTISAQPDFTFVTGGVDEPFSVSVWVNLEDASSSTVLAKYQDAGNLREWLLWFDGNDSLLFKVSKIDGTAFRGRQTGALTAYQGEWIHIVGTYNGNEACSGFNLYINGVDSDTTDVTAGAYAGMTFTAQELEIGVFADHTSAFFDGKMAEVKVFDVELTPAQVLEDYQTGYDSDLVGYWKLDDGAGNPQDSSGNGFHATANTADWLTATSVTASGLSSGKKEVIASLTPNILANGSFETGDPPTGWSLFGAGATQSRSAAQKQVGSYSLSLTRNGTNCTSSQDITNFTDYQGDTLTLGCWVYATVASRARVYIDDGSQTYTPFHSGVAGWEWLTATKTISPTAPSLAIRLQIITGDTTAYFDSIVLIEAASIADYGNFVLSIDGTETGVWTDNSTNFYVPDNNNDWYYLTNGAMPYMEYTKITVDDTLEQHIEWEYTAGDFTDLSGNSHDATPSYRTESSDEHVSAELTLFLPIAEAQAPAWSLDTTPGALVSTTTTTTGNFSTTPTPTGAPFIAVIEAVSNATATPSQLPFTIIAGFAILALSLGTSYLMRKSNANSLWLKVTVITALFGICIALDIFDFWMLIFFLLPAIAIIMMKTQGAEV